MTWIKFSDSRSLRSQCINGALNEPFWARIHQFPLYAIITIIILILDHDLDDPKGVHPNNADCI